ncbi:kinase-like protein [Neolentinus lepideus HHB14362 ss-1]|uniref:Casein kinase II subunit alpha n=1 Tax=Neolentinus lepideus HHB14362 ss-1 TaxID=1314782 RepID=A0A165NIG7_9AGAM|nr:kinase-like protein [Neolentinus lepideus HHB14362 ss-1]
MARVYANVNAALGRSWYDYESLRIEWNGPDRYEVVRRVGGGKYSEVFEGVDMVNDEKCVIKVLKPVASKKIKREIKILRNMSGGPNVVSLLDVVRDPSARYRSLIMEYVENVEWKYLYPRLTEADVKYYIFQLLRALDFAHSHGIMHRDVKPGNVMIDHQRRKIRLIDWGMAEFYHPGTDYQIRVGSRFWKAPEVLVGYQKYDYSLDIWALGCMFASMVFRREHFFRGSDNQDQLLKIVKVLGTDDFDKYLERYNIQLETDLEDLLKRYPRISWQRFVNAENQPFVTHDSLDLLEKMFKYDHRERVTAREAQAHSYFDSVRLVAMSAQGECVSDSGFYST